MWVSWYDSLFTLYLTVDFRRLPCVLLSWCDIPQGDLRMMRYFPGTMLPEPSMERASDENNFTVLAALTAWGLVTSEVEVHCTAPSAVGPQYVFCPE